MSRWDVQWRLERLDMFSWKRDTKRLLGRKRPKLEGSIELDRKEIGRKGISSYVVSFSKSWAFDNFRTAFIRVPSSPPIRPTLPSPICHLRP